MPHLIHPLAGDQKIWEIWQSITKLHSLMAADELGLFMVLEKGSMDIEAISKELHIQNRAAVAITEYMESMGLLNLNQMGKYELNNISRTYLIPNSDYYWGCMFRSIVKHPLSYDMFVKSLKRNSSSILGEIPLFDSVCEDDNLAEVASYAYLCRGKYSAAQLEKTEAFRGIKHLLDIGGGIGTFSAHIVNRNKGMTATILELPTVCRLGEEYLKKEWGAQEIEMKISFKATDFLNEAWPRNADGMFFSDILHDWDFETCHELAGKAYEALQTNGKVFILEFLKNDDRHKSWLAQSYNMAMMIYTQGQQFTFEEIKNILECAGFKNVLRESVGDIYTLISAQKI